MTVSAIFAMFSKKKRCIDLEQTLLNYIDIDVLDEMKFQFLGSGY